MKPVPNTSNITIAGSWNRMIFTPDWVGKTLFNTNEVEVRVPLLPVDPMIFISATTQLSVGNTRLIFVARENSPEFHQETESMAIKVLNRLDDTPVSAIGMNFSFRGEPNLSGHLQTLLSIPDESSWLDRKCRVRETKIGRTIEGNEFTLNLLISKSENIVKADFNYHKQAEDGASNVAESIENKCYALFQYSIDLLRKTYGVEIDSI